MAEQTARIVVVGGGSGGTISANHLVKELGDEIHAGKAVVSVVSGSKTHIFQPGYLHVAFKNHTTSDIVRDEETLLKREVHLIQEDAEKIDLAKQEVTLKSGTEIRYDYLIIATGSVTNPETIPGLKEGSLNFHTSPEESRKIWNALEQFDEGHLVIGIGGVPHKCPPSPNEGAFLVDDYLRERGIRDKVKITFVTPYPRPYPAEPMSKVVEERFKKREIDTVTFFNLESVDPVKHEIYSLEGESISYDLLIMVPPHRGADVILKSGIGDVDGWIPTDKNTMKIKGNENAYAIGDCTDIPVSKTGVTAHLEAMVAADNIISSIRGEGRLFKYNGRINCPFEMGSGKASFVVASYNSPVKQIQPSRIRYMMKKVFALLYWRTLSGEWDWLLNAYFGKTSETVKI